MTDDMPERSARLVRLGAASFTVAECAPTYDEARTMMRQWQGLVKFSNRSLPWGVGIAGDPATAMSLAIDHALTLMQPPAPRKRNRPNLGANE